MHPFNSYFDNVYVLFTDKRVDRQHHIKTLLSKEGLEVEWFKGLTGDVVFPFWRTLKNNSSYWPSANTLACNISHLSIYAQALNRGEDKILILEDDLLFRKNLKEIFQDKTPFIPDWDLFYLCYIPLTDDEAYWDYNIIQHPQDSYGIFKAFNLWSLMSYGVSSKLMSHILSVYSENFPCEIDRYFVKNIQTSPDFTSIGISPNLFCGANLGSDNDKNTSNCNFTERTIDRRFSSEEDFKSFI